MKIYPLILALFIGNACADSTPCAVPGAAPEIMLKDQIEKDTGLVTRKFPVPVVEVLSAVPAGDLLAGQLADASYAAASKLPGEAFLPVMIISAPLQRRIPCWRRFVIPTIFRITKRIFILQLR